MKCKIRKASILKDLSIYFQIIKTILNKATESLNDLVNRKIFNTRRVYTYKRNID